MADEQRDRSGASGSRPSNPLSGPPPSAGPAPSGPRPLERNSDRPAAERQSSPGPARSEPRGSETRSGEPRASDLRTAEARPSDGAVDRTTHSARSRTGVAPLLGALALGLILGAFGFRMAQGTESGGDPFDGAIDRTRFQAVILTNDKVYFGKLSEAGDTFFRLDEAYFLREVRESEDAEPRRSLLPINNELHAPENSMLIRQDEVVLVENLDEDSPLLDEIRRQKADESDGN